MRRELLLLHQHWRDPSKIGLPAKPLFEVTEDEFRKHAIVISEPVGRGEVATAALNVDEVTWTVSYGDRVAVEVVSHYDNIYTRDNGAYTFNGLLPAYLLPRRFDRYKDEFVGYTFHTAPNTNESTDVTLTNTLFPAFRIEGSPERPIIFTAPSEAHSPDSGTFLQVGDDDDNMACVWLDTDETMQLIANLLEAQGLKVTTGPDSLESVSHAYETAKVEIFGETKKVELDYFIDHKGIMATAYFAVKRWLDLAEAEAEQERKEAEDAAYFAKVDEFTETIYNAPLGTPTAQLAPGGQKIRVDRYERFMEKYLGGSK